MKTVTLIRWVTRLLTVLALAQGVPVTSLLSMPEVGLLAHEIEENSLADAAKAAKTPADMAAVNAGSIALAEKPQYKDIYQKQAKELANIHRVPISNYDAAVIRVKAKAGIPEKETLDEILKKRQPAEVPGPDHRPAEPVKVKEPVKASTGGGSWGGGGAGLDGDAVQVLGLLLILIGTGIYEGVVALYDWIASEKDKHFGGGKHVDTKANTNANTNNTGNTANASNTASTTIAGTTRPGALTTVENPLDAAAGRTPTVHTATVSEPTVTPAIPNTVSTNNTANTASTDDIVSTDDTDNTDNTDNIGNTDN